MGTATAMAATTPTLDISPEDVGAIRSNHEKVLKASRAAINYALKAGLGLLAVQWAIEDYNKTVKRRKDKLKFGEWVKTNCGFSRQTAYNYLSLIDWWSELGQAGLENLTMTGALKVIRQKRNSLRPGKPAVKKKGAVQIKGEEFAKLAARHNLDVAAFTNAVKELGVVLDVV